MRIIHFTRFDKKSKKLSYNITSYYGTIFERYMEPFGVCFETPITVLKTMIFLKTFYITSCTTKTCCLFFSLPKGIS